MEVGMPLQPTARTAQRPGRSGLRIATAVAATLTLAASALAVVPPAAAQTTLNVQAGVGDGTVAAQAFMPGEVSIPVGGSVTWNIGSDDPHTITFGEGPADVPPDAWPVEGFTAPDPATPPPYDLGTATWEGTGFVNTGILPGKTSKATVTFPSAGTFPFNCVIHPGMSGTVNVVEEGVEVTTQEQADAAAAETSEFLLGQVDTLRAERLESVTSTTNDDGSTTWNLFADAATEVGPLPGGGTGLLELLEFTPPTAEIAVGDTIHWTAARTHTVTFVPEGVDPATAFPEFPASFIPPMGGSTYDGTEPANSGFLNFGPGTPSEYSLTFTAEGVFPFFCGIHVSLGQVGTIAVGVPLPAASPGGSPEASVEAPASPEAAASPSG
jgi:plastocyanin